MGADTAKRRAAEAALAQLPEQGVVGLGTGSTARFFIDAVAELVRGGRRLMGVPTSEASRRQAEAAGVPLLPEVGPWDIAVVVDGADEVDAEGNLIKGGGGALTREKIVNQAARRSVVVVDLSKLSKRLGERFALPVEVLPFGHAATARSLGVFGNPILRRAGDEPFRTDSGNLIYDLETGPIVAPAALERDLCSLPGVVECGLFVMRADLIIIGREDGVEEREIGS